jgi:hypothetical protein
VGDAVIHCSVVCVYKWQVRGGNAEVLYITRVDVAYTSNVITPSCVFTMTMETIRRLKTNAVL